jgi:hypothetical protein
MTHNRRIVNLIFMVCACPPVGRGDEPVM